MLRAHEQLSACTLLSVQCKFDSIVMAPAADNAISESTAFVITPVASVIHTITSFSTSAAFLFNNPFSECTCSGTFPINLLLDFVLVSRARHLEH